MEKITKQTTYLGNKIHQIKDYLQLDKNSDNRYHIHEVINKSLRFLDNELQHSKILVELIFDDNISTSNMDIVHMMQVLNFLIKTCIQSLKNCIEPHLKITTNKIKTNLYSITITDNSSNSTTRTVSNLLATPADETIDLIICKNIIEAHGGILLSQASSSGNNIQFTLQE